jgi:3',5'-cyclic AMP phosphodiesterase CpdA
MILIQLTDLHCVGYGRPAMRRCETNALTERALRAVRGFRPRPDAVLITGDLTDNGRPEEYALLADMLKRTLDMPVYVIPGNHDRRENFRAGLAHLPGVTTDAEFVQYTVEDLSVRLIMLDTVVPGAGHGVLCPNRMAWLEARLAEQPARPTLIAMHHPPFIIGIGHNDKINLHGCDAFAALMARHPQVTRIICGHHHRPVTVQVGHAIASISPGVAHQVELDLVGDTPGYWNLEPAAFQVHMVLEQPDGRPAIVSHTAFVESYPGPFPFLSEAAGAH